MAGQITQVPHLTRKTFVQSCGDTIGIITKIGQIYEARRLGQLLGRFDFEIEAIWAIEKAEDLAGIDKPLNSRQLRKLQQAVSP